MRGPADGEGRGGDPAGSSLPQRAIVKWLIGLRLVAVSALFVGALLVQTTTEEILPIVPLAWLSGFAYLLTLLWIALWLAHLPPAQHGALQLAGDLFLVAGLVHFTGGLTSPFPFLFLVPVGVAAVMFGLRGSLTMAGAAFVVYAAMAEAELYGFLRPPRFLEPRMPLPPSSMAFQVALHGAGFGLVALLTSYLAHSLQQAQSRLRGEQEATARFQALSADVLRSVDSGVVATDADGTIVLANPAANRMLAARLPLEGKPIGSALPLAGVSWDEQLRAATQRQSVRLEGFLASGGPLVGCTVTPIQSEAGAPLGFVVHFRDLTEVRAAAERDRLRQRLVAVGEMAAGMAHEIRNPLASISGSAQVLGTLPGLAEKDRRLLRIIVEESRRLSGIIDAFLSYARPSPPRRAPCALWDTLGEVLSLFANSPEVTPAHTIETDIQPLPHPIVADEAQWRQAFFNLARNAVQAMPEGGTMRVVARPDGSDYIISWSDEGVGMTAEQVGEIFEPFKAFRTGGTGLGLSVVYSIVAEHGGDISVTSRPGEGSTFVLRIPVVAA
mgnify:CR=1 FL=1